LAGRLSLLVMLALLPPFAIQAWTGVEHRREREAALRMDAVAQTLALQADMARTAEGTRQLLVALAEMPAIRANDAAGCTAYLQAVARQYPAYALLAATDAEGGILCSSAGAAPGSYSNAERAYYRRAMAAGNFAVGDLVTGVATGRRSIHFALPFRRADDSVGGIVLASLDQEQLARQLAARALPPGAEALVLDPAGTVVAGVKDGHSIVDDWVGRQAPGALRAGLEVSAPTAVAAFGPDGNPRLFGAVPLDPALGGLVAAVGLDQRRALADLKETLRENLAGILLGAVLALAAGVLAGRRLVLAPLAKLALAAGRVGEGELGARADLGRRSNEIREVGAAFNRMSAALAAREGERDRSETAQRESEARFRHMADSAPALIWMSDAEGQVVFANRHYDHLFGRPVAAMLGQGWEADVLPEDLPSYRTAFRDAFRTRQTFRREARVRDKQGQVRWLRCEAVPRLNDQGSFLGYTGCAVDITEARLATEELETRVAERTAALEQAVGALHAEALERESAEAALRQSQKMEAIGQLTGGIAHDFNNMLQVIGGSLEMIQRRVEQGRGLEVGRYLDNAQKTVVRASGLTHRLLAFARRQALQPTPLEPGELVEGMAELIRRTVGPAVTIQLHLDNDLWSVLCDPSQLENVLLNLAINARDAMPEGGTLTIATAKVMLCQADVADQEGAAPGEYVEISVADTGMGMDEATKAHAFEPFFTTKPIGQGTGLGLSQVYGFVRQSGGLVRLDSSPGQGTTVRLRLPRHESFQGPQALETPTEPAIAGANEVVLLVEDEKGVREAAAERLRELRYTVLEAEDGLAALRLLESDAHVDLLVTDVGLPNGMNGRQLADAARERRPSLPVLFITGYAGGALEEHLAANMAVIGKPFTLDVLARNVKAMLEASNIQ